MTIRLLTPEEDLRARQNPLLNIDSFIVPSPFIRHAQVTKDYDHSYLCVDEGEILGYMQVYSDRKKEIFHIYTIATSPFGRGRGIGTAFLERLVSSVNSGATIYLYIWEKQLDTLEFFQKKGFTMGDPLVYRKLIFYCLSTQKEAFQFRKEHTPQEKNTAAEEIGKTRHDARKTLRLLSNMVETLSLENCDKIIEDVNRETTALVNMLNAYRDAADRVHEMNLKELLFERIIPYVEGSSVPCQVRIKLDSVLPVILGNYDSIGRALINLTANALEAIAEAGRPGILSIGIRRKPGGIYLTLTDNGTGIPSHLLKRNSKGLPAFVGKTTKKRLTGEGLGTRQIFSTFGARNIYITSSDQGTSWRIRCAVTSKGKEKWFLQMKRRYHEILDLWEDHTPSTTSNNADIITFIWQLRKMELFLFDVILQFSKNYNIRTIYRTVLAYLQGNLPEETFSTRVADYLCDDAVQKTWLLRITLEIKRRWLGLEGILNTKEYKGELFKSYGQGMNNIIIFTMDPEDGRFLATDRKLAEHLDFVPYLGKTRDQLLRGEFVGAVKNSQQPIFFGIWSAESEEDLQGKLELIQQGAARLLEFGIQKEKRLSFYQTTYMKCDRDIDINAGTSLGEFVSLPSEDLGKFTRPAEEEMENFIVYRD